jgi:hypothetical protein
MAAQAKAEQSPAAKSIVFFDGSMTALHAAFSCKHYTHYRHFSLTPVCFIRQFWFNTPPDIGRALAAAQTMQRSQKFGIKLDHIINFLYELALR